MPAMDLLLTWTKGKLKLKSFTHAEFNDGLAYKFIKENVYIRPRGDKKHPIVCSTGYMVSFNGAAMNKEIGVSIHCLMEMDCFVQALHYTIKNLPRGQVVYKISPEEVQGAQKFANQLVHVYAQNWCQSPLYRKDKFRDISLDSPEEIKQKDEEPFITEKDIFPCVMAMCGSAFGFMPIYDDKTYGLSDVVNRGGRMWLGLGSVLTGGSNYEELMKLAEAGDNKNIDLTIYDVLDSTPSDATNNDDNAYNTFELKDMENFTLFSFAKAAGKTLVSDMTFNNDHASMAPTSNQSSASLANALSDDTLEILRSANLQSKQGNKRRRVQDQEDGQSTDHRAERYPVESKKHYLELKTLYKKKLRLAITIEHMDTQLQDQKFPHNVDFKCAPPQRMTTTMVREWNELIASTKSDLTRIYLSDLKCNYKQVKLAIKTKVATLQDILDQDQIQEIKDSLKSKYKSAAVDQKRKFQAPKKQLKGKKKNNQPTNPRGRQQNPKMNQAMSNLAKAIAGLKKSFKK